MNWLVFVRYFEDEKSYWYICGKYYYNYRKNIILDKTASYGNSQKLYFRLKGISHYIKKLLQKSLPVKNIHTVQYAGENLSLHRENCPYISAHCNFFHLGCNQKAVKEGQLNPF